MRLCCLAVLFLCTFPIHVLRMRGFDFENVIDKAAELAKKPYEPPRPIPKFLHDLSYAAYQSIRFKPADSLWSVSGTRFQVMFVSPGLLYTHIVNINVADDSRAQPVPYRKDWFSYPSREIEDQVPPDLGYAGFKLTYPLERPDVRNQFLVFAGASYFRGVGKNNVFGLSARGIAVDTGLSQGEQFPSFVEYWLVRPDAGSDEMVFYALLDGQSLTGAYRFAVTAGSETRLETRVVLFPRKEVALLGIAPLTSMFYYGENTPRPPGEWRPQVHDSDGLLVHGSTGEWLWRPLINPKQLEEEYFEAENVPGFGLLQRNTSFYEYQDGEARYDKRPSAWIRPNGNWGKGNIVLVQIPSDKEADDNIVAFWSPKDRVPAGGRLTYGYTLAFGGSSLPGEIMGRAVNTFVGDAAVETGGRNTGTNRLIADFEGGGLSSIPASAKVQAVVTPLEDGEVIENHVEYVEPTRRWRLSILARPARGKPLSLRAFLKEGAQTLTETWTYRLPWGSRIDDRK